MNDNEKELVKEEAKKHVGLLKQESSFADKAVAAFELIAFCRGAEYGYNLAKPTVLEWQTTKPKFTEDCICLTVVGKSYSSFIIKKVDNGFVKYMACCDMNGEEYVDLSELSADKYLIVQIPK